MADKKKEKKPSGEKLYSYDEYRKEFGVVTRREQDYTMTTAKIFGAKLAQEALRKVKRDIEKK